MTSPIVNIFVIPGLYVNPQDVAGADLPFERCGGSDRWCSIAPGNLTGVCGTWLGMPDQCCWVATRSIENDNETLQNCDTIAGIRDTPFNQIGSSDAFNSTSDTCPSGNYEFYEYDSEQGSKIAACCPNGQTGQVFLIDSTPDYMQYFLDSIRCGTFEVSGEVQNPTSKPILSSTSQAAGPMSTSSDTMSTGGETTSRPPASITSIGSSSTSAPGGQTTATTTSNSAINQPSKLAYLIVGSIIFGLFFGGNM